MKKPVNTETLKKNIVYNKDFIEKNNLNYKNILEPFHKKWILIGASPTLDYSFEKIKTLQKHGFHIAACDMAVYPLFFQGIYPDFIFSVESKPVLFFMKKKYLNNQNIKDACLLFPASVHPYQIRQAQKLGFEKYIFFNWETDINKNEKLITLPSGGSVFNAMTAFFGGLKDVQLTFAGNDLKFVNHNLYAKGAMGTEKLRQKENRFWNTQNYHFRTNKSLQVNINNEKTIPQFAEYKKWLNDYLKMPLETGRVTVV